MYKGFVYTYTHDCASSGMKYQSVESEFSMGAQIICCTNFDPRAHRIPEPKTEQGVRHNTYLFRLSIFILASQWVCGSSAYLPDLAGSVGLGPRGGGLGTREKDK